MATLWVLVDSHADKEDRAFLVTGTGHPVPSGFTSDNHVGTVLQDEFVWHIWEPRPRCQYHRTPHTDPTQ